MTEKQADLVDIVQASDKKTKNKNILLIKNKEELAKLSENNSLAVTGISNQTALTYFIASNPEFKDRIIFWLLRNDEIDNSSVLLKYWQKSLKKEKQIWNLSEINPLKAANLTPNRPQIILADFYKFNEKIPSLQNNEQYIFQLHKGQPIINSKILQKLESFGYEQSSQASDTGYYSKRGGLIDIFPINLENPVRIELEENKISQINFFNPINKKRLEEIENITIIAKKFSPAHSRTDIFSYFEATSQPLIIYQDSDEISNIVHNWTETQSRLDKYQKIIIKDFSENAEDLGFTQPNFFHNNLNKFAEEIRNIGKKHGWKIRIATNKQKNIEDLFKEKKAQAPRLSFLSFVPQLNGFQNKKNKIIFLTDKEIFGEQNIKNSAPRHKVDQAFLMGLKPGDFVVHLDHGIGKFIGMTKNQVEGIQKEYFILEYAEGDKLYVPIETADKISKYIGVSNPKLHRLSGTHWYQLTRRVKQEAKVLAQELLKIYAKREMIKIKPFNKITPEEKELKNNFPYSETPDQIKAIRDVQKDLEKETPMDRLICGDVGFGKTEVAVRAAFKAVVNKKQVALLSPTTILTQQHYDTFKERLKKFPVTIGILSRFESEKEQKETIEKIKAGTLDIIIGTHRLLSNDVNFRNLGLIIIDEEQRFGVKAKEKLKTYRSQAHILTLTATPIPRTLNIALSGVRDISLIETPPEGRLPIETHIEPYDTQKIKKVIYTELKRGGQVYFLHNKVKTISFAAKELNKLIPGAKIGIAHGRMPEKDLAKAMADFDNKKTDILVCSTIIENGLDLPNVNTMIVDNATNFGLAQLYQLRGRIGRGQRQAYAYFLYHRKKLVGNAKKRLQALMEAKKLGSGFQLALRDLEIRGAGNILGKEQHGKVASIGLSLYTRLIAQAIEELKFGKIQEPIRDIIIDLPMEAYIPSNFLPEEERLLLYQKMAGIMSIEELKQLKDKIIRSKTKEEQRHFPKEILNLFEVLQIRLLAQKTDISNIDTSLIKDESGQKKRVLILKFLFPLKPEKLARLLQKNTEWKFTDDTIKIDLKKLGANWLEELKKTIRIFQKQNDKQK